MQPSSRYLGRLTAAFAIALVYFVVEAAFALMTDSLTLLADAGHMLTDTVGLGMALAAISVAARAQRRGHRTFGLYRLEVLAALANAVLLLAVAAYVLWHAVLRMSDPVHLPTHQMLFVAIIGLAANLAGFLLLQEGAKTNLNMRGAYLEVVADAIGSAAVILAAVLILLTGWAWVDPAFAIALAIFIVPRTLRLASAALRVLLQAAPPHVDLAKVESDLRAVPGVVAVDDLHVWTLTSEMDVATAHLRVAAGVGPPDVLAAAQAVLHERHGIGHATLQVEPEGDLGPVYARWCEARSFRDDAARDAPEPASPAPRRGRHRRA